MHIFWFRLWFATETNISTTSLERFKVTARRDFTIRIIEPFIFIRTLCVASSTKPIEWQFVTAQEMLARLRSVKTPTEIVAIRSACEVAEKGFVAAKQAAVPGARDRCGAGRATRVRAARGK